MRLMQKPNVKDAIAVYNMSGHYMGLRKGLEKLGFKIKVANVRDRT